MAKICFESFLMTLKTFPKAPDPSSSTIVKELKLTWSPKSELESSSFVELLTKQVSSSLLITITVGTCGASLKSLTGRAAS